MRTIRCDGEGLGPGPATGDWRRQQARTVTVVHAAGSCIGRCFSAVDRLVSRESDNGGAPTRLSFTLEYSPVLLKEQVCYQFTQFAVRPLRLASQMRGEGCPPQRGE